MERNTILNFREEFQKWRHDSNRNFVIQIQSAQRLKIGHRNILCKRCAYCAIK